jgi:uncharacterized protein (TIGR02145 family)
MSIENHEKGKNMKNLYLILIILFSFIFIKCTVENNNIAVEGCPDPNSICEVKIGNQVWMCKNLDVARYRNGDLIPQVTNPYDLSSFTTGAWCYYDNDTALGVTYGKLYNWYAVNDSRGLAPKGWHIASDPEWTELVDYLGGDAIAGGMLKETGTEHWQSPNVGATNESGFTALPGGVSNKQYKIKSHGHWWTSTMTSFTQAIYICITFDYRDINRYEDGNKSNGYSVRCVKD